MRYIIKRVVYGRVGKLLKEWESLTHLKQKYIKKWLSRQAL